MIGNRIMQAFFRLMPGRGHFPWLEDPASFNRLLEETVAEFAKRNEGNSG